MPDTAGAVVALDGSVNPNQDETLRVSGGSAGADPVLAVNSSGSSSTATPAATTGSDAGGLDRFCQEKYYSFQELEERKSWYSTAAEAYDAFRPKYSQELLDAACATIPTTIHKVLEIGCGPGTATVSLLERGYQVTCVEPNPDFCRLAEHNTRFYEERVDVHCTSFEEFSVGNPDGANFDAVVAATCIHWIPAEIAFPKSAELLKPGGSMILLWNMQLYPNCAENLTRIVEYCCPPGDDDPLQNVIAWGTEESQLKAIEDVAEQMIASGRFQDLRTKVTKQPVRMTAKQYSGLLTTYSPCIRLDPTTREEFLANVERFVDTEFGGSLDMYHLSVFQVATRT